MTTTFELKSKKKFNAPALFVNPQSSLDASVLRTTIATHPSETANIEGIVVELKDWEAVKKGFHSEQAILFDTLEINNRVRIMDPCFHILFQGYVQDKEALMSVELEEGRRLGDVQLISGGLRLRDVVLNISSLEKNKDKIDRYVAEAYRYMDSLIKPVMQYEIQNHSDIVVIPSVPITSSYVVDQQIEKAKSMNIAGKILANTFFGKEMEKRDLMFMATVNMSMFKPEYYDQLIGMLLITNDNGEEIFPDQIGIRLMNADNGAYSEGRQSFLDFISKLTQTLKLLKKNIPIHIFNTREFGYVTYAYGATTTTNPIATTPYIRRTDPRTHAIDLLGKYYHPLHMIDYTYDKSLALSRSFDYILPCHCIRCQSEQNFTNAKKHWNEFRRIHFLLAKHIEMQEIKEAPATTINRHLQQKFSRSKQPEWLAYLDKLPILTFN